MRLVRIDPTHHLPSECGPERTRMPTFPTSASGILLPLDGEAGLGSSNQTFLRSLMSQLPPTAPPPT